MVETIKYNKHASTLIIAVGVSCMIVAGYFLIEGLSQFSGNSTTRNILIIGGILFQIAESLCFIAAAALAFHSRLWRVSMFALGCVLFLFSVAVMTLAQKTALQSGINEASAIDEKRQYLREQLLSLDRMIESYQYNAEKQSRSIYKDSRALGQDSINRATDIEQKKLQLSDQLFALNQERKETSVDFFNRLQEVTGLPARKTEFYFLVLRSLLIELCGILLMAFGASLRALAARNTLPPPSVISQKKVFATTLSRSESNVVDKVAVSADSNDTAMAKFKAAIKKAAPVKTAFAEVTTEQPPSKAIAKKPKPKPKPKSKTKSKRKLAAPSEPDRKQKSLPATAKEDIEDFDVDTVDLEAEIQFLEDHPKVQKYTEHRYSEHIQRLRQTTTDDVVHEHSAAAKKAAVRERGNSIIDLYQKGVISSLNREEIINGLRKHNKADVDVNEALDMQIKSFVSQKSETAKS